MVHYMENKKKGKVSGRGSLSNGEKRGISRDVHSSNSLPDQHTRVIEVEGGPDSTDAAGGFTEVTGLGVQDRNLSRVAKKLQKYVTDAATLSNVPDRARVHFKDQQIWLELKPVAKALVLLELHPGRFAGDRFTEPLIATLSDVCDETTFRVVHGGHLLSGEHQVYLVLEGEDYSQMCYEFITRVIETANTRLMSREKLPAGRSESPLSQSCYRYNIIPILPQGEFDMDLIRAWKDRGSRKAS